MLSRQVVLADIDCQLGESKTSMTFYVALPNRIGFHVRAVSCSLCDCNHAPVSRQLLGNELASLSSEAVASLSQQDTTWLGYTLSIGEVGDASGMAAGVSASIVRKRTVGKAQVLGGLLLHQVSELAG
jgi:hypothetical protein